MDIGLSESKFIYESHKTGWQNVIYGGHVNIFILQAEMESNLKFDCAIKNKTKKKDKDWFNLLLSFVKKTMDNFIIYKAKNLD